MRVCMYVCMYAHYPLFFFTSTSAYFRTTDIPTSYPSIRVQHQCDWLYGIQSRCFSIFSRTFVSHFRHFRSRARPYIQNMSKKPKDDGKSA